MILDGNGRPYPVSPTKVGAQIQPEGLGMMRFLTSPRTPTALGSIWAPTFVGETDHR